MKTLIAKIWLVIEGFFKKELSLKYWAVLSLVVGGFLLGKML